MVLILTGHPVDGSEGPKHPDSADGREADVLKVEGVLQHAVTDTQGHRVSLKASHFPAWPHPRHAPSRLPSIDLLRTF